MRLTFIEHPGFTEWVTEMLSDEELASLQRELQENPGVGDVMQGCGGLRKVRCGLSKSGRGRRGGGRIVYLHVEAASVVYLIDGYSKSERDDLSRDQQKILAALAAQFREEIVGDQVRRRKK